MNETRKPTKPAVETPVNPNAATILVKLQDSGQYSKRRDIVSDSGNKYRIAIRKSDRRWTCSCMGWKTQCNKKGTDCKHIKALKDKYGPLLNDENKMFKDVIEGLKAIVQLKNTSTILEAWTAIREKAEMVAEYCTLVEDTTKTEAFTTVFKQAKVVIMAALTEE